MRIYFNELWILNQSGAIIFQIPKDSDILFIDKCFSAIEIIAKEIKDDFHVSIIDLDKNTISMIRINLKDTSIYLIGIIKENLIGKEKKIISTLKQISKLILKSISETQTLHFKENLVHRLQSFIRQKA